ncbi:MAG: rhodanese-like domain-containing protein [Pseudomonadota bacterium]
MKQLVLAAVATALSASFALADTEWKKLVTPAELAAIDGVTVVDIRDPKAFATAHLPGAVNAPYGAWRGPANNPGQPLSDTALTALLQASGLDHDDQVVVAHAGVNQTDFGAAARVYWTLKSAGFPQIAILNGGVRGWVAAGEPLSVEIAPVTPSTQTFTLSDEWAVDGRTVAAMVAGERKATLVDARPDAFFAGQAKHPAAKAAGTLKGAKNLPFAGWFDGNATEIADATHAGTVAANLDTDGEIVSFCNTGHWAATNWFALSELAGKDNVKLYPESMVGWVNGGGDAVAGQ